MNPATEQFWTMKFSAYHLMAALLMLSPALRAEDTAPAQSPYTALVSRNIFGLVPVPPPPPPPPPDIEPPPKITPNGTMNLFGKFQVLFKTPGKAKPGQPPKEESYMMGVGERQDDIEVKKIDEKAGLVTFDNHGVIQELPLVVAAISGPAPSAGAPGLPVNGQPPMLAPGMPGGLRGGRFGQVPRKNVTSSADIAPSQAGLGGGAPGNVNANAGNLENLSPEAQVILIEKNRLDTQQQVNAGTMPPLPPTVLTPEDATAHGGSPLIVPTPPPTAPR